MIRFILSIDAECDLMRNEVNIRN